MYILPITCNFPIDYLPSLPYYFFFLPPLSIPPSRACLPQLLGYCDEILDMRLLGSGSTARLAVATNSEHVKIFHRGALDCQVLHGHSRVILALDTYTPSPPISVLLVTSSKDRTVRVWEEGAGGERSEFVCKGVGSGHTEAVGAVALARYMYMYMSASICLALL